VRLTAKAEGVPSPTYQWFSVDRANNGQILPGETNSELVISNLALGISRYVVSVTNSVANAQSRVATLSVEQKLKLAQARTDTTPRGSAKPTLYNIKTADDIERDRARHRDIKEQEDSEKRQQWNNLLKVCASFIFILAIGVFVFEKLFHSKQLDSNRQMPATNSLVGNSPIVNSQTTTSNQSAQAEVMRDTVTNKNTGIVPGGVKISATNSTPKTLQMPDYSPPSTNKASTNAQVLKGAKK
jgi:hypothetical protein